MSHAVFLGLGLLIWISGRGHIERGERDPGLVCAASHMWLVSQPQEAQTTRKPEVQSEWTFPACPSIPREETQGASLYSCQSGRNIDPPGNFPREFHACYPSHFLVSVVPPLAAG